MFTHSTFLVARREWGQPHFFPPELDASYWLLLVTKTCCMDLMGTFLRGMQMYAKWPES